MFGRNKEGNKDKKTIATGFIVAVLIVLIVGQGSLWIWFLFTQRTHNQKMLDEKIQMAGKMLAGFAAEHIDEGSRHDLSRYVKDVVGIDDIAAIKILNGGSKPVVSLGTEPVDEERPLKRFIPFFVTPVKRLSVPIVREGSTVGSVEITYSSGRVNDEMERLITIPPIVQLFVFLLVIRAIYYLFQRSVGRPIGALQQSLEKATAGDLTVEIPKFKEGEIAVISEGLSFLVERLSSNISRLEATADNVAKALIQLNATFRAVIEVLRRQSSSMDDMSLSVKNANEMQRQIAENAVDLSQASADNVSLLQQFKSSADEIVGSANKLYVASDDSYSIVAEMAQTSKEMAKRADQVLNSVDDIHGSLGRMLDSVGSVQTSAKDSAKMASNVREIASERGVFAITDVIEGMEKIVDRVGHSADIVKRLGSRSKDVQKMLSVIKDVTEQTNLLSLNAAILAQQAGEYGQGFSVVADEMRQLSDRTAASTKEIASLVRRIQEDIGEVVSSIEDGMTLAQEGSRLADRAGESMGSIVMVARDSAHMATGIDKATEHQAEELRQIAVTMNAIRSLASQMSVAMKEQQRGSGYMLERVGEVKDIADVTKRGIEEQAAGTRLMSKNIELANEKVSWINRAAINQQSVNDGIISSVEQIRTVGINIVRDVESVSLSLRDLQEEINMLRKEMEAFKVV